MPSEAAAQFNIHDARPTCPGLSTGSSMVKRSSSAVRGIRLPRSSRLPVGSTGPGAALCAASSLPLRTGILTRSTRSSPASSA